MQIIHDAYSFCTGARIYVNDFYSCSLSVFTLQKIIQVYYMTRIVILVHSHHAEEFPWDSLSFISLIPHLIHNFHRVKTWLYFQTNRKIIIRPKNIFLFICLFPSWVLILCLNNFEFILTVHTFSLQDIFPMHLANIHNHISPCTKPC